MNKVDKKQRMISTNNLGTHIKHAYTHIHHIKKRWKKKKQVSRAGRAPSEPTQASRAGRAPNEPTHNTLHQCQGPGNMDVCLRFHAISLTHVNSYPVSNRLTKQYTHEHTLINPHRRVHRFTLPHTCHLHYCSHHALTHTHHGKPLSYSRSL